MFVLPFKKRKQANICILRIDTQGFGLGEGIETISFLLCILLKYHPEERIDILKYSGCCTERLFQQ